MDNFYKKEEQLISEYNKLKPLLGQWGRYVDGFSLDLLGSSGFDFSHIQIYPKYRPKTDISLIRRAFYRNFENSSDPLKKIEDKIGTRIVVTTLDDVKEIRELIMNHSRFWTPRESRGIEKYLSKPNEFGYQSLHINLTPTNEVPGFETMEKKQREYYICELQVRTLLQHAFAEVAHDTIYKGAFGADSQLVRILSRGMALMEVTDESFCQAYEIMKKEETYEKSFLNRLITLSSERLGVDFSAKQIDNELTSELFNILDVKKVDISDVERIVTINKDTIINAISKSKSYLINQPVLILIIHKIFVNAPKLKEVWPLEEDILQDIFYRLGIAFRK